MADKEDTEDTLKDEKKMDSSNEDSSDLGDEGHDSEEWIGDDNWGDIEEDDVDEADIDVPNFVDNGDGTVSDPRSNLMWCKIDSYAEFQYGINWFEANDYVESLNEKKFAGFDDWRLCGLEEAKALFSFSQTNVDKDGAEIHIDPLFEPDGGHNTWTYEEKPDYQQYANKFSYVTGNEHWEHKDNEYSHVRAVRDERKEEWEPKWRKESKKFEG